MVKEIEKKYLEVQRYGGMRLMRKNETIFAAYDKVELSNTKFLMVANSDFVHNPDLCFGLTL